MKKLIWPVLAGSILLAACNNSKEKQKALVDGIIKKHDSVMNDSEKAQMDKMKLDTLMKQKPAVKDQATFISAELVQADSTMEDWMHQFNPEFTGKSADDVVNYLSEQKTQLNKIDAQLKTATQKADQFISQNK